MKVFSRVTHGHARAKTHTPDIDLATRSSGYGLTYTHDRINTYRRYAAHGDRNYVVEFSSSDLDLFLRDLATNESGRRLLERTLQTTKVK